MPQQIAIHRANADQADLVAPAFDAYRQFYQQPADLAAARAFLAERLSNSESIVFFAQEQNNVLGFTQLYPVFTSVGLQRDLILNDLFVTAAARRRGVAGMLMDAARDHAANIGARGLGLETSIDNTGAQTLYEAYGYQRDTDHYHYYYTVPPTS